MHLRTIALAALGLLLATSAYAATHQVVQSGFTFAPADLTIDVGDTVEWVHASGIHTVTEGTDDSTPPIGSKLFDAPLTTSDPIFSFTFTSVGDVDYYCRPHLVLNMVGIIRVQQPTSATADEAQSWSRVKNLYR